MVAAPLLVSLTWLLDAGGRQQQPPHAACRRLAATRVGPRVWPAGGGAHHAGAGRGAFHRCTCTLEGLEGRGVGAGSSCGRIQVGRLRNRGKTRRLLLAGRRLRLAQGRDSAAVGALLLRKCGAAGGLGGPHTPRPKRLPELRCALVCSSGWRGEARRLACPGSGDVRWDACVHEGGMERESMHALGS